MAEKFDPKHADKLENPERLVELPPAKLVELLRLSGAETVIDFGAGTGMYSIPLAAAVPLGRVLAVDEQPELLERLRAKLASHPEIANVEPVLSRGRQGAARRRRRRAHAHRQRAAPRGRRPRRAGLRYGGCSRPAACSWPPSSRGWTARSARANDHVLPLDDVRALLAGAGLEELALYAPGSVGLYHNVIVAEMPRP